MSIQNQSAIQVRQRLDFLDIIRLTAMLLMVQGHTLDSLVSIDYINITQYPWHHWHALRGLTAPIFLMLSGAVGILSMKRENDGSLSPAFLKRRTTLALGILALAYLLVFPANRLVDLRWLPADLWRSFFQTNILHLNGCCLLIHTGVASLTRSDRAFTLWSAAIGLLLLFAAPHSLGVNWFAILPESVAAYLSPVHGSMFPLFPHGAFFFLGTGLGYCIKQVSATEAPLRFRRFCAALTAVAALTAIFLAKNTAPSGPDPYGFSPTFTLIRLALALPIMAGICFLAGLMPKASATLAFFGRKSLQVYVGHIILLYGLPWFPGISQGRLKSLTLNEGLATLLLVLVVTFGSIAALDLIKKRSQFFSSFLRITSALFLAWALIF